jgi:uncharacterized membrane protein
MLPDPLHPAIVHFPIVLMFLLPISAIVALWAIGRGTRVVAAWSVPVAFAAALTLSSWVATQTGEPQAEAVEQRVSERFVEEHEEAAELFLALAGAVLAITAAGMLKGRAGHAVRIAAAAAGVALIVPGYRVGHTGGSLVYTHGAAGAATAPGDRSASGTPREDRDR